MHEGGWGAGKICRVVVVVMMRMVLVLEGMVMMVVVGMLIVLVLEGMVMMVVGMVPP